MKRYFPFLMLIFFLFLILGFSAQSGDVSNSLSSVIAVKIEEILLNRGDYAYDYEGINFIIRKLAHFFEFMILAVLIAAGLNKVFRRIVPALIISGVASIGVAFIDEIFQSISVNRSSSLFDVMIDGTGAVAGLIAIGLFSFLRSLESPRKSVSN